MSEITFRTNWNGNTGETISKEQMIARLINKLPTYEIIGETLKYNFDVDLYCDKNSFDIQVATIIKNKCIQYITDGLTQISDIAPNFAISSSHTNNYDETIGKYSFHFYVSNMMDKRTNMLEFVKDLNNYVSQIKEDPISDYIDFKNNKLFDESIYSSKRKIRCINTSKPNEDRPLILELGTLEDTILSYTEKCSMINYTSKRSQSPTSVTQVPEQNNSQILADIHFLLFECIKDELCSTGKHTEWNRIAQAMKNVVGNEGIIEFVNWNNQFACENKRAEAFKYYSKDIKVEPKRDKDRLTMGTIHFYAKQINPEKYAERFKSGIDNDICDTIMEAGDVHYAKLFVKKFGYKFVCIDIKQKLFYEFTDNCLWELNEGGSNIRNMISNEFCNLYIKLREQLTNEKNNCTDDIRKEQLIREIKKISEIIIKLNKTNDKNNILREIQDLIYNSNFSNDMNKNKLYLPIKNKKVINVKTLEVLDRTIKHKFNYECDVDFVSLTEEQGTGIGNYFLDLFCGKQDTVNCVIDIIKSIFCGDNPLRYIFFFTGSGRNGKSLLFKLLQNIFKKAMDTISTDVILQSKHSSALTTHFEKLGECKLAYVTELKEEQKLNEDIIKKITGGDAIDYRGLYKKNTTINPTATLCIITNELPEFKKEQAITDRAVVIPFNNRFEVDSNFETIMMSKLSLIFSYIMKRGTIRDKFDLTEEMIASKNEYIDSQTDLVADFIKEKLDRIEYDGTCNTRITNNDCLKQFQLWMQENSYKESYSNKRLTKEIKKQKIICKESNHKTWYYGLKWKQESELDCDDE